ncbi:hypothetical protein MPSEU_000917700 [Mayamaea pseudoterrestris]|nr:hypothetical protein MPSEU_000917700 [Mayamaea pseudoterrestris]
MDPMQSNALESYSSVNGITCGDIMYEFIASKANQKRPEATADQANKLMTCFNASVVKIQESPCKELRQSYADCLLPSESVTASRRTSCLALQSKLQECAAMHVGRLD